MFLLCFNAITVDINVHCNYCVNFRPYPKTCFLVGFLSEEWIFSIKFLLNLLVTDTFLLK